MLAIRFTKFVALAMLLALGLAALVLLAQADTAAVAWTSQPAMYQASKVTIDWLRPDQVHVPSGLAISAHATKHNGEAEQIYALLLQGQCAAVAKFCGGSNIERMYICVDPVTGIVGAMLQFGDEITTGYFSSNSNYWPGRIARENWKSCQ